MAAGLLIAAGIGFWPIQADVFGDASYSCGSGFIHSAHTWNQDSQTLAFERTATDTGTGTPKGLCPNKVESRRDLALLVLAFSLGIGLIAQIVLERPLAPSYGSSLFANRRGALKVPAPRRRPQVDPTTVQTKLQSPAPSQAPSKAP